MALYDPYGRPIYPSASDHGDLECGHETEHADCVENKAKAKADEPPLGAVDLDKTVRTHTGQAESYEEKHYRLQKRGLLTQQLLCVFTALAFGAAAWYAHVASKQVDVMQRQLESTDRPWIKVTGATAFDHVLTFESIIWPKETKAVPGVSLDIGITVENVGRSVALNTTIRGKMVTAEKEVEERAEWMRLQSSACSGADITIPMLRTNIFPGDKGVILPIVGYSTIRANREDRPENNTYIKIGFVGCVIYTIPTSDTSHYSAFMYELRKPTNTTVLGINISGTDDLFRVGDMLTSNKFLIAPIDSSPLLGASRSAFDAD